MIILAQIQERIARAIKESGLSQAVLGERLGVSQQTISHYFKGSKFPALDTFANLCLILDIDANYILCLNDLA